MTQREDASQVRTGHAPQNLAALRNLVINLFRLDGRDNIAAAHRHYADQPDPKMTVRWASGSVGPDL